MNLVKEKEILKEWIEQESIDNVEWRIFPGIENTYWKQHKKTTGIEEYDFSTITEIKEKLHAQWEEEIFQSIEQVLSIIVLKAKEKEEIETEVELPAFVYVF